MALFHSERGSVNYTIVGSPTIIDGVVSGFSSSNYLTLPNYSGTFTSYEIFAKFTTGNVNTQQAVLGTGSNWSRYGFFITSSAELYSGVSDGSTRYNVKSSLTLQDNTTYYAQMKADLLSNTLTLKVSTDNTTWTTDSEDLPEGISLSGLDYYNIGHTQHGDFSGSIDLNNTYIKVNGQAWFGVCPVEVKHIDYGAPNDYVLTGNALVKDGVLIGVDSSSTCSTTEVIPDFNKFELVWKCGSTDATIGSFLPLFAFGSTSTSSMKITWTTAASYGLHFDKSNTSSESYLTTVYNSNFNPITNYNNNGYLFGKFIVEKSGDNYNHTIYASADGVNWTSGNTYTDAENLIASGGNRKVFFNRNGTGSYSGKTKMFFSSTYIKIDGKLWFFRPATDYVKRNDKLVFADSGLNLSGPENYTVVGSPVIEDGIVSGFSDNNYIISENYPTETDPRKYEFFTKIKINGIPSGTEYIISYTAGSREGIALLNDGRIRFFASRQAGTSGDIAIYSSACSVGDEVLIHTSYVGEGVWKLEISKDNGTTWETKTTTYIAEENLSPVSTELNVYFGGSQHYTSKTPFVDGSIDMKMTYIKVDGSLWFYGKNYATQNIAPVHAGYPIGGTTTPAIGWVDMRTQTFTSAPVGAVLDKDDVSES